MKKLTIEYVVNSFELEGYKVLSKKYINSSTPIKYKCPEGHIYQISWNKWQQGRRCPYCNPNGKVRIYNIDYIRKEMLNEGYTLLTNSYINCSTKLKCICPEGHLVYISWDAWKSKGNRCAECSGNKKLDFEYVKSQFEKEGYELLSNSYKNAHSKLKYKCPKGHRHSITWSDWNTGVRCPYCSGKVRHTLKYIKNVFETEGYTLLTKKYINGKQKLNYICPNGHEHSITWNNWQQGQRCPYCLSCWTSKGEKEVVNFLKGLGFGIIENDRTIIQPYELDIVIPEKKIAIEYCGLYWHSELSGKDKNYHKNKLDMCSAVGYRLITIFEDEWKFNKDLVISTLKLILGIFDNVLCVKKCKIKEVGVKTAINFCEENHLQGYNSKSVLNLGIFYNKSLISIMTFSKLFINNISDNDYNVWELDRFCSKKDYFVVDAASKLLKFFEKNYKVSSLISYVDRRWYSGNLYNKLGFTFSYNTKPNYWYFKGIKREMPAEFGHISENYFIKSNGWNKIWDCGNLKFNKIVEDN